MTDKKKEADADAANADIVMAAAEVVSVGGSFLDLLTSDWFLITCGIEIENWTRYPLTNPCSSLEHGVMAQPPPARILPAKKEIVITRKTNFSLAGSVGTVSWLLGKRRVVIMWSVPYYCTLYSNWLGIGLTKMNKTVHDSGWFQKLYWDDERDIEEGDFKVFKRSEFYSRCDEIFISDDDIEVSGSIGTGNHARALVTVKSSKRQHLALSITDRLTKVMSVTPNSIPV